MLRRIKKLLVLLAMLTLSTIIMTTAAMAAEDTFDTENFKGLVLTTSVGSDQVWVRLYKGYTTPKDANLIQPVYTEKTADGGMAYYYELGAGRYKCFTRHPSNSTRYYTEKSIYMSAEEVATKTVHDVTTGKRSTSGWDPSSRVYLYTDEVMAQIPSSPELWPDYADCFTTPAFGNGRNDHAITSQTEMMNFLDGLDGDSDDMYTYILGQSGGKAFDIPLVVFTKTDLSGADTLEAAAARVKDNSKVTVYYQAQIHGYETAAGEGALAMIQRLDGQYGKKLLEKLNIVVIPRLSPYGAYKVQRNVYLASGDIDPNGDFMRLRTVETQLRQKAINLFTPEVGIDGHEFILSHESTSEGRRDILLAAHFLESQTEEFQQQSLSIADTIFDKLDENGLCYRWYDDIVNNVRGSVGSGNAAYRGILHFLVETQGSDSGLTNYERRVVGQVTVATAIMDYAYENAETVKSVVRQQRQMTVNEGKTYDEADQVVLEYGKVLDETLAISGNKIDLATGVLTPTTFSANVWKSVIRARTAPTAYVIPAGESFTEAVLKLMDMQGISYYAIPAGSLVNLQQYKKVTLNDSGKIIEAALTDEQTVAFPQGAYVFTLAQENANILSLLMEPDVTQNTTNTLVQAGTISIGNDDWIPIYRYVRDLNSEDKIDYAAAGKAPEGLKAVGATKIGGTGKITGLIADKAYEYRAENDGSYTAVTPGATEITDLPVGKYYVRFAATAGNDASADALVEVAYGVLEEYAVYLDSVNGAATNDGYTEVSAINTIDLAYSQLSKLMESAPAGTTGKIVIVGTYTVDGERILPEHNYPLLITGGKFIFKETSPAGDYRYLGMGGDTTFDNITISVGSATDSYYLYAQGHKFTIGENVVCEPFVGSSSSHYFSISGGKKGGGTVATTDITVKSGRFTSVYAADYTGKVTDQAKAVLFNCRIYRLTPSYIGNTHGDVYMEMRNVIVGKEVLCGHRNKNSVSGDVTLVLGEGVVSPNGSALPIYAGSNSAGNIYGKVTIIADGIDLAANPILGKANNTSGTIGGLKLVVNKGELADVADTFVTRDGVEIVLGCDQTKAATLNYACNLDLAGHDAAITVADGKTLTVCDTTEGELGVLAATGTTAAAEGYQEVAVTGGKSYPKASAALPGDMDGDGDKDTNDAVYLLLSAMFGDTDYPIAAAQNRDVNKDGKTDTNDAVYLLLHVMFGAEDYPI